jgi:AMP-binding enzyme
VAYNCLDKQIEGGRGGKVAYHWIGEPAGETRDLTYEELLAEVSRVANAFRRLGVRKGDRVGFIFGRFLYKARRKRRTIYPVTDKRVLAIVTLGPGVAAVDAAFLSPIPTVTPQVGADGTGNILFDIGSGNWGGQYGNTGMEFLGWTYTGALCFFDVPDAASIADLVNRRRNQSEPTAAGRAA